MEPEDRLAPLDGASRHAPHLEVLLSALALVSAVPIPTMLRDVERCTTTGPILDPTLWIKNGQKLELDAELLRAALPLWNFAAKLRRLVEAQEVPG